jgi:hypothetical protein
MHNNMKSTMTERVEAEYAGKAKHDRYHLSMRIARQLDDNQRLFDILIDDTELAMKGATERLGDQHKYRTLVRTIFAAIQGQLSIMKQTVILGYGLKAIKLTDLDIQKLHDEISISGIDFPSSMKPIYLGLKDDVKFTFDIIALLPGVSARNIDTTSRGWHSFCKAITIRDNLTHPQDRTKSYSYPR